MCAASEDGVLGDGGGSFGGIGWATWLILRDYWGGDLVQAFVHHEETEPQTYNPGHTRDVWHIRLTPAGRAYYLGSLQDPTTPSKIHCLA